MARAKKEAASTEAAVEDAPIEAKNEPEVEVVKAPAPEVVEKDDKPAIEGIEEIRKQLAEERQARLRAERERNEAIQRAYTANNEKEDTNLRLIESAIHQVQANSAILEGNYANAIANGDAAQAAKIMREMAANEAKALQLENGKQSLKEQTKAPQKPLDPVEALASQLSPRSAAWVRAHPEYATEPKLTQKMIAAHNLAVADGIPVDSDDYFGSVEETLKINRRQPVRPPAMDDDWRGEQYSDAAESRGGRQVAPAAIPVSRDISTSGRKTRGYTLTVAQQEAARESRMTNEEYAAQLQRIERERRESMN